MNEREREPIGVIGAGWVGLCTAACFAELGHEVWCRDIVQEKVEALTRGEVPIYEPGLSELIEKNSERLHFTTEMSDVLDNSALLFCCVDTPPTYSGDADLSRVDRVVEEVGDSPEHALVMKSTVPVGTGRSIRRRAKGLAYVSNPEFLKEGSAVADFMHPDRVVVGSDGESNDFAERVSALYEPLDAPIVRTDVESAEMIKLASNAFLATKISFINEIANVSEELGADVTEVARGMGLDERIGPQFLRAGIGYGGSCLVGEESVLVRRSGRVWRWTLEEMWERIAEQQPEGLGETEVLYPEDLEVLSWRSRSERPEFLPVSMLTRRDWDGEIVEVRTKMGRRVRCTPDHPFVVADANGSSLGVKLAEELGADDWLPIAQGAPALERERRYMDPVALALDPHAEIRKVGALKHRIRPIEHPVAPAQASGGVTGPNQIEDVLEFAGSGRRAIDDLAAPRGKQIASIGYRRHSQNAAWVRVIGKRREPFRGPVYSLEVPDSHTVVLTGGLVLHQCFPKDVSALKQLAGNTGYHFQLLTAVIEVNELQKRRTVGKLQKHLGSLVGKEIALLGLAFKPDTDDIREATSLVLAARLSSEGAQVRAYDPIAAGPAAELLGGTRIADSALAALDGADGAVLVTEWPQFRELDWAGEVKKRMRNPLVVDGRNFLDGDALRSAGFMYEGVGR